MAGYLIAELSCDGCIGDYSTYRAEDGHNFDDLRAEAKRGGWARRRATAVLLARLSATPPQYTRGSFIDDFSPGQMLDLCPDCVEYLDPDADA